VRETPNGTVLGSQDQGDLERLSRSCLRQQFVVVDIDYNNSPDGWSAEGNLSEDSEAPVSLLILRALSPLLIQFLPVGC